MFFATVYGVLISEIQRQEERVMLWKAAPESEKSALLEKWAQQDKEFLDHKKSLEIAEAGRSRNFWGK